MEEFTEKKINAYMIVNWKTGSVKVVKRIDRIRFGNFDIPIKIDLTIKIPRREEIVAKGEIVLPKEKVKEIAIGYLKGGEEDGD